MHGGYRKSSQLIITSNGKLKWEHRMLGEPFLKVINSRTSLFGHWLTSFQYNVGLCLLLHVKGQLFPKDLKFQMMALSGGEETKDSFTEKTKYISTLTFVTLVGPAPGTAKKLFLAPATISFGNFSPAHEVPEHLPTWLSLHSALCWVTCREMCINSCILG